MTKRKPFGSFDPNVQRYGDSVASSVPSVEEALRLKRRKKKSRTLLEGNNGSFLIDSTSKTPRISNRSKQQALPPKSGVNKQLRRLEQSMANRAKQEEQAQRAKPSEIPLDTTASHQDIVVSESLEIVAGGVNRKGRSGDTKDDGSTKKLKLSVKDASIVGGDKDHVSIKTVGDKEDVATRKVQGDIDTKTHSQLRSTRKEHEDVVATKQGERKDAEYLDKRRSSDKHIKRAESLVEDEISSRSNPERTELPIGSERVVVDSQPQVTQEAMMDCTSDDESLHLSPGSSTASPFQENVKDGKCHRNERARRVETEEAKRYDDGHPRLSNTTPVDGVVPLRALQDANEEGSESLPQSMEELVCRESSEGPLVTKGMLSRARKAKADNEDVVAAMMKSGPPYMGRKERRASPDASMIGTMIGVHPSEDSASVDGSEVTMLTTVSYLNDFRAGHTSKKHDVESNDKSGSIPHVKEKKLDQKASPHDVSSVPEANSSHVSKSRGRDSSIKQMKNIREPEEDDEGNQVIYFEHNGVMIPHPRLPSGWIIRVSQSKQRPFYCHPDHGSTWHCPIVLPQESSDPILKSIYEPSIVNTPVKQEGQMLNGDDTESEDSELWSPCQLRKDVDSESAAEGQSLSSVTTASSTGRSQDTAQGSNAEAAIEAGMEYHGSSDVSSLASSVVEKGMRAASTNKDAEQQRQDETMHTTSLRISSNEEACHSTEDNRGSTARSQMSSGSATPNSVYESMGKDDDGTPAEPNAPGVARVSLVETEASTEELSPGNVEELVSTARLCRSKGGIVAQQEIYDNGSDDESVRAVTLPNGTTAFTKFRAKGALASDEDFLASFRESHTDTGSLVVVKRRQVAQEVDPRYDEGTRAESNTDSFDDPEEDEDLGAGAHSVEDLGAGAHSVVSNAVRSNNGQISTPNLSRHTKSPAAVETEQILEAIVEHTVSHRAGGGRQEKPVEFEAEVDDVVFGVDHDDLELSLQAERLSPIKHMRSFDNEDERLHVDTTTGSDDETTMDDPIDASSPLQARKDSLIAHEDSLDTEDNLIPPKISPKAYTSVDADPFFKIHSSPDHEDFSVEIDEYDIFKQDQEDGQLSVESSFMAAEAMDDPSPTKWRGYSHRILHPPHPLDSLMNIEALIKAALHRAERRKKAKKKSSKNNSSRSDRRKTSTKLVFE